MSAILSAQGPVSDTLEDDLARVLVSAVASDAASALASVIDAASHAETVFAAWWDGLDDIDHRALPEELCREVFVAGYLARDLGGLPEGDAP